MSIPVMDLPQFSQLLDRHGADDRRWPAAQRAAAQDLLKRDPSAQAMLQQAVRLDRLLDSYQMEIETARLQRTIAAAVQQHTSPSQTAPSRLAPPASAAMDRLLDWLFPAGANIVRPLGTAALPLLAGIWIGTNQQLAIPLTDGWPGTAAQAIEGDPTDNWADDWAAEIRLLGLDPLDPDETAGAQP